MRNVPFHFEYSHTNRLIVEKDESTWIVSAYYTKSICSMADRLTSIDGLNINDWCGKTLIGLTCRLAFGNVRTL